MLGARKSPRSRQGGFILVGKGRAMLGGKPRPTLDLDFTTGIADQRITFSGGAGGTRVNSAGQIVSASCPRFDYDPVTLACLGLLIEEQRTNSIRNNTMQGASAGVQPTYWQGWNQTTASGLTIVTSDPFAINGMTCIDVAFSGTVTSTGSLALPFEASTVVAAAVGQTWTLSAFMSLVSNAAPLTSLSFRLSERDSSGNPQGQTDGVLTIVSGTVPRKVSLTGTVASAGAAFVSPQLKINQTIGQTYNCVLRIALPQLELGAFATSAIPTTTAAVTRTADSASMTGTNLSSWFNATQGTFVVDFSDLPPTAGTGKTHTLLGVDSGGAGSCLDLRIFNNTARVGVDGNGSLFTLSGISTANKMAAAYSSSGVSASINGGSVGSTGTTFARTPASLAIGNTTIAGAAPANCHIGRIRFYPPRFPDAQEQRISA